MTEEQNIKVTFPPLADEQDGWAARLVAGTWNSPPEVKDTRTTYQRLTYRAFMWLHNRAESFWHWCWDRSRKYAPPSAYSRVFSLPGPVSFKISRLRGTTGARML